MRPSLWNAQPSFWGFKRKLKARPSVWKTRSRVCIMTRPMLSQSATVTSQDIILAFFFFTDLQFQLYSKILNNISTKTDYVTTLPVHIINLLLQHSGWLIWELMIVLGVPLENRFKRWVGNKDGYIALLWHFLINTLISPGLQKLFLHLKILINIFIEHGGQGSSGKILRKNWYGKSRFRWLYYLYTIASFFLFFCISFFLLEVKCRIIKFDFSQNSCQLT